MVSIIELLENGWPNKSKHIEETIECFVFNFLQKYKGES